MRKGDTDQASGDPGGAQVKQTTYLLIYFFANFYEAKYNDDMHGPFRKPQITERL